MSTPNTTASRSAKAVTLFRQCNLVIERTFQSFVEKPVLGSLLLLLAPLLIYAPALSGELIWDDRYLVEQNPFSAPCFALEVFQQHLFVTIRRSISADTKRGIYV